MKIIYSSLIFFIILGCASQQTKENKKNYEITDSVILKLNSTDSIQVNELRFKPKFSSTDLQKFMFNEYGKWNNSIESDRKEDILVWENIKLFDSSVELFTVAICGEDKKFKTIKVDGNQKYGRIFYCSAIVFNSKQIDCFQSSSELKDSLAEYFINGAKSVANKNKQFEKEISSK